MVKKKSKPDTSPESIPASTQAVEKVTVVAPSVDSAVGVEPAAKKAPRSTKKAPKSVEIAPVAEEVSVTTEPAEKQARSSKKAKIALTPEEATTVARKAEKEATSEKTKKMKRLTLDIPKPLHKAIKAQAVEEGISIVDMLRTLLEQHYSK